MKLKKQAAERKDAPARCQRSEASHSERSGMAYLTVVGGGAQRSNGRHV